MSSTGDLRVHGGPDAAGPAAFDFSTNGNACGPCPAALAAVQAADATRYPDPAYVSLRQALADRHAVDRSRIVMAASASEAIFRLTARAAQRGVRQVAVPDHAYGDYRHAAQAWHLPVVPRSAAAGETLRWYCDPSSPTGQADAPPQHLGSKVVLDRAYAPLRLHGETPWSASALDRVWQLWTPNKALGLTGVRAAYLIAPLDAQDESAALQSLAPSWPLGAHGVALLQAWCEPAVAAWLDHSLQILRQWKTELVALCESLGWHCLPGEANFICARLPAGAPADLLQRLRTAGVQVRDCASFGLPGHVRLGVLPPAAQQALAAAARQADTIVR